MQNWNLREITVLAETNNWEFLWFKGISVSLAKFITMAQGYFCYEFI